MAAPKAPLFDSAGKKAKDLTLEETVFGAELKPHVVHETVRAEMNADRRGTRAAKSRGLVSGGRAKPWRQKGTGRARAGTTRAPQWTGGGVAFPPTPRDFDVKVNRKTRRSALRGVLSQHAADGTLGVLDGSTFTEPSTRAAVALLATWGKELPARRRDERRGERRQVFPQHRPRRRDDSGPARGHRARVGALGARHPGRAGARRGEGRERLEGEGRKLMSLHPNEVLLAPVVSEKSYAQIEASNTYSFRIHPDAHKTQVRQAVEELFNVKVLRVNVCMVQSKPKRRGLYRGTQAGLEEGDRAAQARRLDRDLRGGPRLMPVRRYKPTSPGRRFMTVSTFEEVTKSKPEKALTEKLTKKGGRNNNGRITTRHQGGGHKRRYRVIDFKRRKDGVPAKVAAIEYDPNRSARIALLHYADGAKSYILAPARLRVGALVESGPGGRHQAGQRPSAREHPDGHARAQRRAEARPRRPDGAERRLRRPARREGRGLRRPPAPLGRDAPRGAHLSRHDRPGR